MNGALEALTIGAHTPLIIVGSLLIFAYCIIKTILMSLRHPSAPTQATLVLDVIIGIGAFGVLSLIYGLILGVAS